MELSLVPTLKSLQPTVKLVKPQIPSSAHGRLEPLVASQEAASFLAIHPKTLQKMARGKNVPAYRIGDTWRFRLSELDRWLERQLHSSEPLVS